MTGCTRPLAGALDLVIPFVSTDETRPHLVRPARYAGHVVATDGHTMGVARYDGEGSDPARELDKSAYTPPPWDVVLPRDLKCVGEVTRSSLVSFAHFPAKWNTFVTLGNRTALINAIIPARTGKHGKVLAPKVVMVTRSPLEGFELTLKKEVGADVGYFWRCFELATMGRMPACYVHIDGPLDPIVFAPDVCSTKDDLFMQGSFAIMMPVRL